MHNYYCSGNEWKGKVRNATYVPGVFIEDKTESKRLMENMMKVRSFTVAITISLIVFLLLLFSIFLFCIIFRLLKIGLLQE